MASFEIVDGPTHMVAGARCRPAFTLRYTSQNLGSYSFHYVRMSLDTENTVLPTGIARNRLIYCTTTESAYALQGSSLFFSFGPIVNAYAGACSIGLRFSLYGRILGEDGVAYDIPEAEAISGPIECQPL